MQYGYIDQVNEQNNETAQSFDCENASNDDFLGISLRLAQQGMLQILNCEIDQLSEH
jgi:hypothetical protein